ncbi:peptide methionine sulfoxide reductase MsrA isoform X1 [Erpetoichthys calabaricus]|uniref:Mitochondrial peptide methionine sulfoxide reductase n=1 Tax=Erpetoichthys calabaricus TaxID=27687 RepID=A0A8C4XFQ3_ERPCA|nr:peptide methionine sulfoxide reductase MsrA isoform X1 [Erpetoichthys calabaricus]
MLLPANLRRFAPSFLHACLLSIAGMSSKTSLISKEKALPGRSEAMVVAGKHAVSGHPVKEPFPEEMERVIFGMGCFWGAERRFWKTPGVYSTHVGYAGGFTVNPLYKEVGSGLTGHSEVVRVIYEPKKVSFEELLKIFWENHDPTQGMRQGQDVGTQYRSVIYTYIPYQLEMALKSKEVYQKMLNEKKLGTITTEIKEAPEFYYAEDYHQQYLHKVPNGYCGLKGTGVSCPIGLSQREDL